MRTIRFNPATDRRRRDVGCDHQFFERGRIGRDACDADRRRNAMPNVAVIHIELQRRA